MNEIFCIYMETLITVIHIVLTILTSFYAFLFKKTVFDYIYLIILYFILLQWTYLNGECLISYVVKKIRDKDYVAGTDVNTNELEIMFKGKEKMVRLINSIKDVFFFLSIYFVYTRNNFTKGMTIFFVLLFGIYHQSRILFKDHNVNNTFLTLQEVTKYLTILYGFVFFHFIYKRFYK